MTQQACRLLSATVAAAVLTLMPSVAHAQLIPCERTQTAKTKKPLTALPAQVIEPKKTLEGWPDLQGAWTSGAYPGAAVDSVELGWDPADVAITCKDAATASGVVADILIDPMRGMIPYQPWAKAKHMEYLAAMYAPAKRMDTDTDVRCFPRGVPRASTFGGFELRYAPGFVIMNDGSGEHYTTRIIPMDGRSHVSDDVKLYMGDAVGHWEGNTLVVETTNNRDGTSFDKHATFHSEKMRVVERWTLVDQNTMYYETTIYDADVFTQPWKMAMTFDRNPRMNRATQEATCHENGDRFVEGMVRTGLRARAAGIKGYHIHVDLNTGKAVRPEEQEYLDQSGQPLGTSYAPLLSDEELEALKQKAAAADKK